jgi:hypothetical protein
VRDRAGEPLNWNEFPVESTRRRHRLSPLVRNRRCAQAQLSYIPLYNQICHARQKTICTCMNLQHIRCTQGKGRVHAGVKVPVRLLASPTPGVAFPWASFSWVDSQCRFPVSQGQTLSKGLPLGLPRSLFPWPLLCPPGAGSPAYRQSTV